MSLFETYRAGFQIGMMAARFLTGAAIGGSISMIIFFFDRRILFGLLSFVVCGLLCFISLLASIICGVVLIIVASILALRDREKTKEEKQQLDEKVGPEWNKGIQQQAAAVADDSDAAATTEVNADECWTKIAGWRHRIKRYPDGRFNAWHHVTQSDRKLGTEVNIDFPSDYFSEHTLEDFYDSITDRHLCVYGSKEKELEELKAQFISRGWINA